MRGQYYLHVAPPVGQGAHCHYPGSGGRLRMGQLQREWNFQQDEFHELMMSSLNKENKTNNNISHLNDEEL